MLTHKTINFNDKHIDYALKVSDRTRRMRIAVYCDGNLVVTVPQNINENIVENFVFRKSQWIFDKLEYFKNFSGYVFKKSNKKEYKEYKEKALILVKSRIEYFNQNFEFKFNKINIKNQKTRWGSCSKRGNLNFNYKIVLLPERLADYIVVHELCHLKEFNHSQQFWNLVAKIIPNYSERRNDLKKSGITSLTRNLNV